MSLQIGILMDPIGSINIKKDSSFAMLLAAQKKGWTLFYMEQKDLYLQNGSAFANMKTLSVKDDPSEWFQFHQQQDRPLKELDIVLMRKDPPFDMDYIYCTYLLEHAVAEGTMVVNNPASLRDANEKLYTAWFAQCCAPTLVTQQTQRLKAFIDQQRDVILKPLGEMGGSSIFRLTPQDPNLNVILETITQRGSKMIMAQRFIPEIEAGDKRILLINGEPVPYALARIPAAGDIRGNLAAGARAQAVRLTERDYWICRQVGPTLKKKGLVFVGLDVIGDYLTEINVTSPTCIRELDAAFDLDIGMQLMDCLEQQRQQKTQ